MRFMKRNKRKTETVFCSGKDEAAGVNRDFNENETMIREADRLYEACENYRLAPMVVKKYYLSLYYSLLRKYGDELANRGLLDQMSSEYRHISLYQDAGRSFAQLHHSLRMLACRKADEKKKM